LIDGIEIKKYNIKKLRERMGLVMQEPTLFNYTVKENILYGNPTASNKEIVDACQVANARVFIESEELQKAFDDNIQSLKETMKVSAYKDALIQKWTEPEFEAKLKQLEQINAKEEKLGKFKPVVDQLDVRTQEQKGTESLNSGYEILCGNRGSKLSGGQKQRTAIARAVLRNPAILVLDDALSSVDTHTAAQILEGLRTFRAGRTAILIAQRIATVREADSIIVLHEGTIAEQGTHAALVALNGRYAAMYQREQLADAVDNA
jgi:ABC-type multidrug transport system fused ATPase/permease subunit